MQEIAAVAEHVGVRAAERDGAVQTVERLLRALEPRERCGAPEPRPCLTGVDVGRAAERLHRCVLAAKRHQHLTSAGLNLRECRLEREDALVACQRVFKLTEFGLGGPEIAPVCNPLRIARQGTLIALDSL